LPSDLSDPRERVAELVRWGLVVVMIDAPISLRRGPGLRICAKQNPARSANAIPAKCSFLAGSVRPAPDPEQDG
jgi:hypothetical protein